MSTSWILISGSLHTNRSFIKPKVVINNTQLYKDEKSKDVLVSVAKKIQEKVTPKGFTGKPDDLWQIGLTKVFMKEAQVTIPRGQLTRF